MTKFKVVLVSAEEGGYIVSCPALSGCHSQGETKKEALANIKEAISLYLETLNERIKKRPPKNGQIIKVAV